MAPNLRRVGIEVDFDRGTGKARRRMIRLFRGNNQPSDSSELDSSDRMTGQIADKSDMSDNGMHEAVGNK
jgi:hypothetical protein